MNTTTDTGLKLPASSRGVGLVIILGALSSFGPLSLDMYLPGLPSLSQDLGGTAWQVQLTLTACLMGLACGQVLAGPLSDGTGRFKPLITGLVTYTVASFLCALAPNVIILILLRFVQGLAGSAGIVIARAVVRDLYSGREAARFFAMMMAVNGLAPILAPVIGGQLLNVTNWRGIFVVLTVIGAVLLCMALFGLKETLPEERRRKSGVRITLKTFRFLIANRTFFGYALSSGLASGSLFAYIAGSPFVLENIYGASPQLFSLIFATNSVGIIIASQTSGRLVNLVQPRRLMGIGLACSLSGGLLLLVAVTTNLGLVAVLPAFFLVVASIGLIGPNATALAMADHPHIAGSASGLIGVLQYIVGGLITPLVTIGGTGTAMPLSIIIAMLSTSAMLIFLRVK